MESPSVKTFFANRIGGEHFLSNTNEYKFAKIRRLTEKAKLTHPNTPIIDLGVGEPDAPPHPDIINALRENSADPLAHGYSDNGCDHFRDSAIRHMKDAFNVTLDSSELLHCLGIKSALSILPKCFLNPGDIVLTTTPGYPVFSTHAEYLGASSYTIPLSEDNNFLPDLESIPNEIVSKAKVLLINYPNNPTGACATKEFFEQTIRWAKKHNIIVINDAAYALLNFDKSPPLSILSIPGAKDIALELHSLSKSFNMTGWRIGWVCGNANLVKAYENVKANSDSGQFIPIQHAAAYALDNMHLSKPTLTKYNRRLLALTKIFQNLGFSVPKPKGTFFLYIPIPKSATKGTECQEFSSGESFSHFLINNTQISTVPWDDSGHYFRISATFEASSIDAEEERYQDIENRLAQYRFNF